MGYFRGRSGLSSDPASPLVGSAVSRKCIGRKPTPKHPAASEKTRLVPIIDVIQLPSIPLGRESPFSLLSSLASRLSSLDSFRSSFESFLEPSSIFTSSLETLFCLAMPFWFNTPVPSTDGTSLTESRLVDEVFRGRKYGGSSQRSNWEATVSVSWKMKTRWRLNAPNKPFFLGQDVIFWTGNHIHWQKRGTSPLVPSIKVILHGAICNKEQHYSIVATLFRMVATLFQHQHCNAVLQIVPCNTSFSYTGNTDATDLNVKRGRIT